MRSKLILLWFGVVLIFAMIPLGSAYWNDTTSVKGVISTGTGLPAVSLPQFLSPGGDVERGPAQADESTGSASAHEPAADSALSDTLNSTDPTGGNGDSIAPAEDSAGQDSPAVSSEPASNVGDGDQGNPSAASSSSGADNSAGAGSYSVSSASSGNDSAASASSAGDSASSASLGGDSGSSASSADSSGSSGSSSDSGSGDSAGNASTE